MYESNATLSKRAKDSTAAAEKAEQNVSSNDPDSNQRAASAHYHAQYANESAGNKTQADKHKKAATQFQEKADANYRAKSFAQNESRAADAASKKADLDAYGKAQDDDRNCKELHEAAAYNAKKAVAASEAAKTPAEHKAAGEAHLKAAASFASATMGPKALEHLKTAAEHAKSAGSEWDESKHLRDAEGKFT